MFKIHSFFPLFNFLMSFLALNFAAGDGGFMSAFEGGGEAPPPDMGEDTEDEGGTPAPEPAPVEGEPKEGEEPVGEKKPVAGEPAPDLTKPLSKEAKKFMGELKQSNPAAWKELNSRIWSLNGLDKKIADHFDEGGIDQAIKLKTDVEGFLKEADADDLGQIKEELSGFRTIDKQIMDGNPAFLNSLPPEIQNGLFSMMPGFVADWRDRDSEGYNRYFGGMVVSTLRDSNFQQNLDMALWKLEEMGVDDPAVKKVHDLLAGNRKWITDLDVKAKAAPEKKVAPADDPVAREKQQIATEKLQLARGRIVSQFRQNFDSKMLAELKKVSAGADGKIPGNVNRPEVILRAMSNLAKTMGSQVESRVDQYLQSKDEEGAFKYLSSQVTEKRLNEAVTKAYRYLYGSGGTAARTTTTTTEKGKDGGTPPPQTGFVTINYDPKASSIDYAKTDALAKSMNTTRQKLIGQNKAVLKNGKRVTWPRDAQAEQ